MTKNLHGKFYLDIDGTERELKCNFGVVEYLERNVFGRPIVSVLTEVLEGKMFIGEVVDTILAGLKANNDTRFKREEIGNEVQKKGLSNYIEFYMGFLTYAVSGDEEIKLEKVTLEDKKK